jgi:hypothetical protein
VKREAAPSPELDGKRHHWMGSVKARAPLGRPPQLMTFFVPIQTSALSDDDLLREVSRKPGSVRLIEGGPVKCSRSVLSSALAPAHSRLAQGRKVERRSTTLASRSAGRGPGRSLAARKRSTVCRRLECREMFDRRSSLRHSTSRVQATPFTKKVPMKMMTSPSRAPGLAEMPRQPRSQPRAKAG